MKTRVSLPNYVLFQDVADGRECRSKRKNEINEKKTEWKGRKNWRKKRKWKQQANPSTIRAKTESIEFNLLDELKSKNMKMSE